MPPHAAAAAPPRDLPFAAAPTSTAQAAPVDEAERTVVDAPAPDAERTMAVVRVGPGSEPPSPPPELTPDAILPPGTSPEAPPEPPHDLGGTSTGPIPRLGSGATFNVSHGHPGPGGPGMPPGGGPGGGGPFDGPSGARRALLAGGAVLGVLLVGGAAVLGVTEFSGGSKPQPVAHSQASAPPPIPTPTPSPTHAKPKPKHKPKPPPIDIRDEKTDPRPLTVSEVFPRNTLKIAGHTFTISKTVINDQCALAANGSFATELTRQHCRRVVRATFVSSDKKIAVTTGIAVMPTDAGASAALKAQDPAHYNWFRGMKATGAPKIDQAGGYAASTMRGRYISYAYVTYADGKKPAKNDKTLKSAGIGFRDSTIRAIIRRAHH